jgi:hypothetical protein
LALEAMRRHPNGFPRYFDQGDNFSAAAMKHFKKHKLLPSAKHSIYSFRHSFKDRLKAAEAPEELIDELMAHAIEKPQYGDRYGLKLKLKYLQAIANKQQLAPLRKAKITGFGKRLAAIHGLFHALAGRVYRRFGGLNRRPMGCHLQRREKPDP